MIRRTELKRTEIKRTRMKARVGGKTRAFRDELEQQRPLVYARSQGVCEAWTIVTASAFEWKDLPSEPVFRVSVLITPEWVDAFHHYMDDDPCTGHAQEIQHRKRRGPGSNDLCNLLHLCRACHRWATVNPRSARQLGLALSVYEEEGSRLSLDSCGKVVFP